MKTLSRMMIGLLAGGIFFAGTAQAKPSLFVTLNPHQAAVLGKVLAPRMEAAVKLNAEKNHPSFQAYKVALPNTFDSDQLRGKLLSGGWYGLESKAEQPAMYIKKPGLIGFGIEMKGKAVQRLVTAAKLRLPTFILKAMASKVDIRVTDMNQEPFGQLVLK